MTPHDALLHHNFAPPILRRDIAMLGLLHKVTLRTCHPDLLNLFPLSTATPHTHATRLSTQRHSKQLHDRCDGSHSELTARSLFGLVTVYNLLPQHLVDAPTVRNFQTLLTNAAKQQCLGNANNWTTLYSPRHTPHADFYTLNYTGLPPTRRRTRRRTRNERQHTHKASVT